MHHRPTNSNSASSPGEGSTSSTKPDGKEKNFLYVFECFYFYYVSQMNVIYQHHKYFLMKQMIKYLQHQLKFYWWSLNGFVIYQHFQVYLFVIRYDYYLYIYQKKQVQMIFFYWHILILKYHVIWKTWTSFDELDTYIIHYSNNQMMKEGSRNK